jgi:imidazolonepropionase-like amidohydrolase
MSRILWWVVLAIGVAAVLAFSVLQRQAHEGGARMDSLVIRGATLIDGTGRAPLEHATVIIHGDKIARIDTNAQASWPAGVQVIDARGKFLIPGLWDTHIHIGGSAGGSVTVEEFSQEQFALNWRAYLYNGVTSIVDLGGVKDGMLQWRKMERDGELLAPRVFTVGPIFTAPGGHPAGTIYKDLDWLIEQATRQVSDPAQAREEVRKLIADGVDAIKAVYDDVGGRVPKLAREVLQAIIEEAHRHGKRVFVHVGTSQDALDALNAGADGLEHMISAHESGLDEALQLAARHGAFWTPTLAVYEAFAHAGDPAYITNYETTGSVSHVIRESLQNPQSRWSSPPEAARERWRHRYAGVMAAMQKAHALDIKIALGTDAGNPAVFHGLSVHRELELLVRAGYSPMEAIIAATKTAAEKLGVANELGTIEPGKGADLVLLSANPLEDLRNTRTIELVIKRGAVYRREELAIKQEAPTEAEPRIPIGEQTINVEQVRTLFVQARRLLYNAATTEDLLQAREQLQALEAGLTARVSSNSTDAWAFYWLSQVQYAIAESFEIAQDNRQARRSFEASLESARRAAELDDSLSDAHRVIGDAIGRLIEYKGWQFAASNSQKARKELERALALDASNTMAHLALGQWYFFTPSIFGGNLERALQEFRKALELAHDEHERFLAHVWVGQALAKRNESEKAREHVQQALRIYPNNDWAKWLLSSLQ